MLNSGVKTAVQMSVRDFLSVVNRTIVALVDYASSSQERLRIAYRCNSGWFDLRTAEIESVSIIDYVTCDDGLGYHKVMIALKDASVADRIKSTHPERTPMAILSRARLTFNQMKTLVSANKKADAFTEECVIAVCWKESSFDPNAQSSASTAKGLMQMTNPAVDTVNAITPAGIHFEYDDMLDPAKAIRCGTYYLQWCSNQAGGDEGKALDRYAGVSGYSVNVIKAENCLLTGGPDPMTCLKEIHSFMIEREERQLKDDPTGKSRFSVE
jgi:hypothetical protein